MVQKYGLHEQRGKRIGSMYASAINLRQGVFVYSSSGLPGSQKKTKKTAVKGNFK